MALVGGLVFSMTPSANAAGNPDPISNYSTYPTGVIPAGCATNGPGILTGATYVSSKHPGDPKTSMADLDLDRGSVITMTWTGFAAGCEGVGITLAAKATQHATFVPDDDQRIVNFVYCQNGSAFNACGNSETGFGPLQLTVPSNVAACNYQLDAIIGRPLADVGPHGSYYNNLTRGDNGKPNGTANDANMLISALNAGEGKCILPPEATAIFTCTTVDGAPGVDVAVTNPDDDDVAHVNVLKGATLVGANLAVPVSDTGVSGEIHHKVAFANNETAVVSVVDVLTGKTIFSKSFTADCLDVNAVATRSCTAGGVNIDLTNTKSGTAHFTVTVDGKSTNYDVTSSTPKHFTQAVAEGKTVVITVTESSAGTLIDHKSFTMDCVKPAVTVKNSCAKGGADFTLTNNGESPANLQIKKNGAVIDSVTVAAGATVTKTYAMAEDETSVFRVIGGTFDSGDQSVTHDCVLAESTTTTPPTTAPPTTPPTVQGTEVVRGAALPRTGTASTLGLSAIAGLLLMVGGLLTAAANRPLPMTVMAKSRSRGR
jgi:hypothetical protein